MGLRLGDTAPDFSANTTEGEIQFHDWIGDSWAILFSHPKDYTPVCTTELGMAAKLSDDFAKRGVKLIAVSVDSVDDHKGWVHDINETQHCTVGYPIIDGADRKVPQLYDMIHPEQNDSMTVRSVFIIDPNKKIRLILTYPASAGRNFAEILRVVDSLQMTDKHKVATPVDWQPGDDVIIAPAVSNEEAEQLFPAGFTEVKPYLRYTPQPGG